MSHILLSSPFEQANSLLADPNVQPMWTPSMRMISPSHERSSPNPRSILKEGVGGQVHSSGSYSTSYRTDLSHNHSWRVMTCGNAPGSQILVKPSGYATRHRQHMAPQGSFPYSSPSDVIDGVCVIWTIIFSLSKCWIWHSWAWSSTQDVPTYMLCNISEELAACLHHLTHFQLFGIQCVKKWFFWSLSVFVFGVFKTNSAKFSHC